MYFLTLIFFSHGDWEPTANRGSWVFLAQANLEEQKEKLYKDLEKGFGKHALVWMVMGVDLRLTFHYVAKGISVLQ